MLFLMFSRGHHDEMETENMNPEDIYNSIKQTTADIQNLSFHSKLESYDPVKKKREFTSQDSGIQDLRNDSPDAVDSRKGNYNPSQYSDEVRLALTIQSYQYMTHDFQRCYSWRVYFVKDIGFKIFTDRYWWFYTCSCKMVMEW